ncbi:MAG: S-layer homology domain-containing protein, partial [Actinobacteria bacterium]|nr:S-layer homology domain-containing protein [Actinomycetota bacterium]
AVIAILAGNAPVHAASPTIMPDVVGHWARDSVQAGVAAGYINGYPDGLFRPDGTITRAEFIKLLIGAMRIRPEFDRISFQDQGPHWSWGYTQAAVSEGIILPSDYGENLGPDARITRREIVLATVRALGKEETVRSAAPALTVSDLDIIASWLRPWAAVAKAEGIVQGYPDGSLGLERTATRAEALVMVQRVLAKLKVEVVQVTVPAGDNSKRYPAEGEPFWTWTYTGSIKADGVPYRLPSEAEDVKLLPGPGKTAWVTYMEPSTRNGLVVRLADGQATVVMKGSLSFPIAVDGQGRFWFWKWYQIHVAEPGGEVRPVEAVKDIFTHTPALDNQGHLWVLVNSTLYDVAPTGEARQIRTDIQSFNIRELIPADGGGVWLITGGRRTDVIQIRPGQPDRLIPLTPRQVLFRGRSGSRAWFSAGYGVYAFDLSTGWFARAVPPTTVPDGYAVVQGPDGDCLLGDPWVTVPYQQGRYWRILRG